MRENTDLKNSKYGHFLRRIGTDEATFVNEKDKQNDLVEGEK